MFKVYNAPTVVEIGPVEQITSALGSDTRPDFSAFPQIPANVGSFDVCPNNTPGQC